MTGATPRLVNPPTLYDPRPNGYSHVAVADVPARIAYVAGQGGEDRDGALSSSLAGQIEQAFTNLQAALVAVGGGVTQVVRLTTYVVDYDAEAHRTLTRTVRRVFGERPPPQTLVPVAQLALPRMKFELDAIAHLAPQAGAGPYRFG